MACGIYDEPDTAPGSPGHPAGRDMAEVARDTAVSGCDGSMGTANVPKSAVKRRGGGPSRYPPLYNGCGRTAVRLTIVGRGTHDRTPRPQRSDPVSLRRHLRAAGGVKLFARGVTREVAAATTAHIAAHHSLGPRWACRGRSVTREGAGDHPELRGLHYLPGNHDLLRGWAL